MTRQHFDYIARILSYLDADVRRSVAEHFAYNLSDTNPKFNRERFMQAAGR